MSRHGWARGTFVDDNGRLLTRVQALVVEAGGRTIVVDTCIGNDKQRDIRRGRTCRCRSSSVSGGRGSTH